MQLIATITNSIIANSATAVMEINFLLSFAVSTLPCQIQVFYKYLRNECMQ